MPYTRLFAKILSGIMFICSLGVFAQENEPIYPTAASVYQAFEEPFVMLVRIQERGQQRQYLERNNLSERLAKFDLEQKMLIQEITSSLQLFTSKVGYYYVKDEEAVMAGDYSVVLGLNTENIEDFHVFIVDPYSRPTAWSSTIDALSIYDRYGKDLPDPFPDYILKRSGIVFLERSYEDMVRVLKTRITKTATRLKF